MKNGLRNSFKALILLACCADHCVFETKAAPIISETGVAKYLSQFGYLPPVNPKSEGIIAEETMSMAISEFQAFMGINVTGNMNTETSHLMTLPRCGVKDKVGPKLGNRARRYAFFGDKWNTKSLTYRISKYPNTLDSGFVDQEIARAFAVWSQHTDLSFSQKNGWVDIEVRFESGNHGDGYPFYGPYDKVLAHAFAPATGIGGDTHFNNDKQWTVNSYHGFNLFQVAVHEFGHALGLQHSNVQSAVMAPTYTAYNPHYALHSDDIAGIQVLYGHKTGYTPQQVPNRRISRQRWWGNSIFTLYNNSL